MTPKFKEVTIFQKGTLVVPTDSPTYLVLKTHPRNKDRVDGIVEWNCVGFIGYKNKL